MEPARKFGNSRRGTLSSLREYGRGSDILPAGDSLSTQGRVVEKCSRRYGIRTLRREQDNEYATALCLLGRLETRCGNPRAKMRSLLPVPSGTKQGLLQRARSNGPMQKIHVDLTGPHVRSKNGYVYLLSAICQFTKYLVTNPLWDKTALSVSRALVKHVYLVYGASEIQVTDQGREFCNEILNNITRLMGIQPSITTAYRPSSNGVAERSHATIHSVLAKMITETQKNWCEMSPYVTFAYNISHHTSTSYSPYYLMFGREPRTGLDLLLEHPPERFSSDVDEFTEEMSHRMQKAYQFVGDQLDVAFDRAKTRYDSRVKEIQFREGDLVWYYCPRRKVRRNRKWQLMTTGPHLIMRRINLVNYVLQLSPRGRSLIVHIDRLRKNEGDIPTEWETAIRKLQERTPGAEGRIQADIPQPTIVEAQNPVNDVEQENDVVSPLPTQPERPKLSNDSNREVMEIASTNGNITSSPERSGQTPERSEGSFSLTRPTRIHRKPLRYQRVTSSSRSNTRNHNTFENADLIEGDSIMFSCDICRLELQTEAAIRRHAVLQHGVQWSRAGRSVPIPEPELTRRRDQYRLQQASGKQRRKVREELAKKVPPLNEPAAETAPSMGAGGATVRMATTEPRTFTEAIDFDGDMEAMQRWLFPDPAATEVEFFPIPPPTVTYDAGVQVSPPTADVSQLVGPASEFGLLHPPAGISIQTVLENVSKYQDKTAGQLVALMDEQQPRRLDRGELSYLKTIITTAQAARRELARDIVGAWNSGRGNLNEKFRAAMTWLEHQANTTINSRDLIRSVSTEDHLGSEGIPTD